MAIARTFPFSDGAVKQTDISEVSAAQSSQGSHEKPVEANAVNGNTKRSTMERSTERRADIRRLSAPPPDAAGAMWGILRMQ